MKTKLMMRVGVIGLSLVLGACGGDKNTDVNYGSDSGKDKVAAKPSRPAPPAKWVRIGRADMPNATTTSRVDLQGNQGTYGELQFEVTGTTVQVTEVQIVFTDGFRWTTEMHQKFQRKSTKHTLRLPANRRAIDRVYVTYYSLDRGGATLTLSGR